MNILIVDDQEENRYLLEALLKGNGHAVDSAANGQEALDRLRAGGIDLIVSDILMPVMDGFQLCRKVRADERLGHIPFIVYTATYTGPKDEELALKIGANRFLIKPCEPEAFMAAVKEVMAAVGSRDQAPVRELAPEADVLKLYSERLVRKLEQKMAQAESEIAARRETERALRESEEKYRTILDNIQAGYYEVDLTGNFTFFNDSMCNMLGFSGAELMGKNNREYMDAENSRKVFQTFNRVFATGEASTAFDLTLIKKDGRWCHLDTSIFLIRNKDGRAVGFRGLARDITERKQMEAALRESEERYRRIFENSVVGIFQSTPQGRFIIVNPAFARMLGYASVEDLLSSISDIASQYYVHAEDRHRYQEIIKAQGYVENCEFQVKCKDGRRLWVSNSTRAYFGADDTILRYEGIVIDISERKRAEQEREKLQGQLIQAQKMESVGRLAGGVAHDFNNMLGVIIGYAELARTKVAPSDPVSADLTEIISAARRSADITSQLLAFARKQIISPRVLDLNLTVEGTLKMLRRLIGEDIDLLWLPWSGLCPVRIDPSQLDQILANLCVNARDAIAGVGKLTIETQMVTFDETYCADHRGFSPGEFVQLSVSDNGCGMDKATLGNLFEPFFTTKPVDRGTGLGLATVYGIVKQNGGFINVYSEPGQGTTFKIYLPRHMQAVDDAVVACEAGDAAGRGETLLVLEDEVAVLKLARIILEGLNYRVLAAETPAEAECLARDHAGRIDLLITDVVMPEMNGRDLAERLKVFCPDLKVLFMSGYTADTIAHHGVLDEGVYFIQKPFSRQELAAKVKQVIGG